DLPVAECPPTPASPACLARSIRTRSLQSWRMRVRQPERIQIETGASASSTDQVCGPRPPILGPIDAAYAPSKRPPHSVRKRSASRRRRALRSRAPRSFVAHLSLGPPWLPPRQRHDLSASGTPCAQARQQRVALFLDQRQPLTLPLRRLTLRR